MISLSISGQIEPRLSILWSTGYGWSKKIWALKNLEGMRGLKLEPATTYLVYYGQQVTEAFFREEDDDPGINC